MAQVRWRFDDGPFVERVVDDKARLQWRFTYRHYEQIMRRRMDERRARRKMLAFWGMNEDGETLTPEQFHAEFA